MCLVCVFIFVRKAEHMYETFFFLIWIENSLISLRCSYLFITTLYPFYSLSRKPNPCVLSSSPSTPQNIHNWASRSSDLISTVNIRRSSSRSSFSRRRPITPRSRFESHFHLLCQWVLEQRVKSSSNWEVCFLVFVFYFFFPHQSGKPIFLFFVCCWDGALIYNPNIHTLHSRNLEWFSLLLLLLNQLHQQPMRFVIFLYTLFGCRESVGR